MASDYSKRQVYLGNSEVGLGPVDLGHNRRSIIEIDKSRTDSVHVREGALPDLRFPHYTKSARKRSPAFSLEVMFSQVPAVARIAKMHEVFRVSSDW